MGHHRRQAHHDGLLGRQFGQKGVHWGQGEFRETLGQKCERIYEPHCQDFQTQYRFHHHDGEFHLFGGCRRRCEKDFVNHQKQQRDSKCSIISSYNVSVSSWSL